MYKCIYTPARDATHVQLHTYIPTGLSLSFPALAVHGTLCRHRLTNMHKVVLPSAQKLVELEDVVLLVDRVVLVLVVDLVELLLLVLLVDL